MSVSKVEDRNNTEEEPQFSVNQYRDFFNNINEGCAFHEIILDEHGKPCDYRFLELNPAFERLTGLKRLETIGRLASEVLPELEPFWIQTYGQVALTGRAVQFDRYTQALNRYYQIYAYSPEPGYFVAIFTDISEHKQIEQHLSEVAVKYSSIFNATSDGVWIHDLNGEILEVNDAYCRMSGYARDELIHMPVSQIEACESPEQVADHLQRLLQQEGHDHFESQHRRKDGSTFYVDITAVQFDKENGRIATFVRDITERKHGEERLAYIASFPEDNPGPIVELNLDGKVQYANPAARMQFPDLIDLGMDENWISDWKSLLDAFSLDPDRIITHDVTIGERVIQATFKYLPAEKLIRVYGTDVTERKRIEKRLEYLAGFPEGNPRPIVEVGTNSRITYANPVARRLFPDLVERGLAHHWLADWKSVVLPLIRNEVDLVVRDLNIGDRAYQQSINYMPSEGVFRIYGLDITEKKKTEEELRQAKETLEQRVRERTQEISITNEQLRAEIEQHQNTQTELEAAVQELQVIEEELRNNNEMLDEAREVLYAERVRYQDLFDYSPDGYLVTDYDGKVLEANKIATELLGIAYTNFIGKPLLVFTHEDDHRSFSQTLISAKYEEGIKSLEIRLVPRHREPIYASVTVASAKDESGKNTLRWTLRDITERKRAEEIILQNSLRNAVLSEVSQSLADVGLDENAIMNIVVQTVARMIGDSCVIALASEDGKWLDPTAWSHNKPAALKLMNSLYTADRHPASEGLSGNVYQTSQPLLIPEVELPKAEEKLSPHYRKYLKKFGISSLLVVPLQIGNQTVGTLGLTRDTGGKPYTKDDQTLVEILAYRTMQTIHNARLYQELQISLENEMKTHEQLIQSEKFAAVGRLLASITHEINNPLQTIKNCLYLSQQDSLVDSPISDFLKMATAETERLSKLVSQLREIYRPPTKGQSVPLNFPSLVDEVHTLLVGYLQEKHVLWQVNPPDGDPFAGRTIEGVPDQLKQVFLNLSLNAIDAMESDGGTLSIDMKMSDDNTQAGITFSDTGPGLPEEVMVKLFEPFVTTKEKGLGLGLVICYDIIQKHSGYIDVHNEPGKGATFTIWLPVREE